ncbi:DUF262 domain-containing protein [Hymenobacter jeollabukensis]|uniref:DUF262 domain-containing protein n=1 Tax=Hymenobacter jeollabukensis TaxID=2025313 RepID=A0A5R8WGU0_9BACT|nr:DUF262 domain-containing protein [Hymenobacter jeollabukensis]TLM87292.1 DUF262 domain-containing protein [Hymenobacter jeollabukensis]
MQTNYYTLWTLLNDPEIERIQVPIIQRDYAQGRSDEKATSIRGRLLDALYTALEKQRPLTLDFVYGEMLEKTRLFVPLDGQQRMTTLFLLHWYLALVDNRLPEAKLALGKFTYETRSSSRAFCENLVGTTLDNWQSYPKLSAALRDTTWFQPAWERDPTVAAMLTMLDALAVRFGNVQGWFERLLDASNPLIGFYFLDMPKVGLTDDLYLKMNARGKPLTDFENWKAEFDLLLQQKGWPELQTEFGQKMDSSWTDLFWRHRREGAAVVDDVFEQYLHFLTRMLAYRSGESSRELTAGRLSFEWFRRVYAERSTVEFLFRTLDFLASVQASNDGGITGLLARLLTKQSDNELVRLFGESQTDIFSQCLQESNPARLLQEQVLLFGMLTYGATVASENCSEADIRNVLRVLRNLLERVRQQQDTQIGSNLRVDDLPAFAAACAVLATADAGNSPKVYERLAADVALPGLRRGVEHERNKAQLLTERPELMQTVHGLENRGVFRGDIHNLSPMENADQLPVFGRAVQEIWSGEIEQNVIIRAWLTLGDFSVSQGRWTGSGEKYFFGNKANWYTVLAFDLGNGQESLLPTFLLAYADATGDTSHAKLNQLISDWLSNNQNFNDWQYYFIKYPEMTENSQGYFAWNSDFSLRLLHRTSLRAKHINPYVLTVVRRGNITSALAPTHQQWINDNERSPLWLHNIPGVSNDSWDAALYSEDKGWRFTLPANHFLPAEIEYEFDLQPDSDGRRWLLPTTEHDRIERVESFVAALQAQGVEYQEPELIGNED